MGLPKHVILCGVKYPVLYNTEWLEQEGDRGAYKVAQHEVHIATVNADGTETAERHVRGTILHECLHGLLEESGVNGALWSTADDSTAEEEKFVAAVTPALLRFLEENPTLVEWLSAKA